MVVFLSVNCLCIRCEEKGCAFRFRILPQLQASFKPIRICSQEMMGDGRWKRSVATH